jgi:hypothetical protein
MDKLKSDYDLFKKRDKPSKNVLQDNRIRNILYISEMVKFRVIDSWFILDVLEDCLATFTANDAKVIMFGLNNCGRFLYLFEYSQIDHERYLKFLKDLEAKNYEQTSDANFSSINSIIKYCKQGSTT